MKTFHYAREGRSGSIPGRIYQRGLEAVDTRQKKCRGGWKVWFDSPLLPHRWCRSRAGVPRHQMTPGQRLLGGTAACQDTASTSRMNLPYPRREPYPFTEEGTC